MAKQHDTKAFTKLVKLAAKSGCVITYRNNKVIVITPGGRQYIAHAGERAFHPLRRFLKKENIQCR